MPVDHYENFPVASFLLPKRLIPAVEAIYRFARSADDLADEGDAQPPARLLALRAYVAALDAIRSGQPGTVAPEVFLPLARVIADYRLPLEPFYDLLNAFQQDVVKTRYADFPELLEYCRRSANPVGCLMLHLYGTADRRNLDDSDRICSALQLINFWQDVAIDRQKDRIYLPQDSMARFGVTQAMLDAHDAGPAFRALMAFEVERARALMLAGAPLALRLPGRIGWELRLVVQGGLRILETIEEANYDVFRRRPMLKWTDWLRMLWRAVWMVG